MKLIIEKTICALIGIACGWVLLWLIAAWACGNIRNPVTGYTPNLERRFLALEDKVSQLEDRMDRAVLGLTNVVYQPFGFRFEGPTNIVVISNVFHSYYPIKQLDRLFHADDKRFDK